MDLPHFKYHPNAYKLDVFKQSKKVCQCCGQARGLVYEGSVYCIADVEALCPWCIKDGSAAKKIDAEFIQNIEPPNGDFALTPTLDASIIDELSHRTPGYVSWQGEYWLTHCNDGCAFLGDLQTGEYLTLLPATRNLFRQEHDYLDFLSDDDINQMPPAQDIAIYKFACLHCQFIRLHCDMS